MSSAGMGAAGTCVPSTSRTTREMEALKTPPSMAAAAHMAYTPGWMFHLGSHCISSTPHVPPKDPPTYHSNAGQ